MPDRLDAPRHPGGLVAIALLLGAGPLMLWMGRPRLALAYFVLPFAAVAVLFLLVIKGIIPTIPSSILDLTTVLQLTLTLFGLLALFHASRFRAEAQPREWYTKWYIALTILPLTTLLVAVIVRTFLFQPFTSPSYNMAPNLMSGDYYFVSNLAYGNGLGPARGDIAVFELPSDRAVHYVSRVIGLPGDRIRMARGVLVINGTPVGMREATLAPAYSVFGPEYADEPPPTFYRETLPNGVSYVIASTMNDGYADNTDEYVVPAGHYFVLGDNRDNSQDSRYTDFVGFIPLENFLGRMALRFWNSNGFPLVGRPDETPSNE